MERPSVTVISFDTTAEEWLRQVFENVMEKSRCDLGIVDVAAGKVRRLVKD